MLFVVYGTRLFSRVLTITERREMGLYEIPMFVSLLCLDMCIIFANLHVCGMMLFNAMLYMLVRYESPRRPMCFRCLMFNFSWPMELLFYSVLVPLENLFSV